MINLFRTLLVSISIIIPNLIFAKPFVIGNLSGQLGNQMFIIAATVSLAIDNNAAPLFPDYVNPTSQSIDNIGLNYQMLFFHLDISNPKEKVKFSYREPHFHYAPIPYKKNMSLSGYFQSEKYFKHNKDHILNLFKPTSEIVSYLHNKYPEIINNPNTVSIHLRSYMDYDPTQQIHPTMTVEYYEEAIKIFDVSSLFVVFSNDIEKCKKEFSHIQRNIVYIEDEMHIHDMYLMSMCKDNIISNSTFSWWAAYLNSNINKVVIAPPIWFGPKIQLNTEDLIPPEWIILNY